MDELATLDREAFAQVWSRVTGQGEGPVEALAPYRPPRGPEDPADQPPTAPAGEAGRLQTLVAACLSDAAAYGRLSRQTRRSAPAAWRGQKLRQARRLATAYFLLSGVRYWPRGIGAADPPESFLPALRARFLAETRRAEELEALAGAAGDPELRELYADLARETRALSRAIRGLVERES